MGRVAYLRLSKFRMIQPGLVGGSGRFTATIISGGRGAGTVGFLPSVITNLVSYIVCIGAQSRGHSRRRHSVILFGVTRQVLAPAYSMISHRLQHRPRIHQTHHHHLRRRFNFHEPELSIIPHKLTPALFQSSISKRAV